MERSTTQRNASTRPRVRSGTSRSLCRARSSRWIRAAWSLSTLIILAPPHGRLSAEPSTVIAHGEPIESGAQPAATADIERSYVYVSALADLAAGHPDQAAARLSNLVSSGEGNHDVVLLLARALLDLGDHSRVPALLAPLVRQDPADARAHAYLGEAALEMGNLAVAARETRRAAELSRDRADLWVRLGGILWRMEAFQEAAEAFDTACTTGGLACTEAETAAAWHAFRNSDPSEALGLVDTARQHVGETPADDGAEALLAGMQRALYERLSPDPASYASLRIGAGYDTNPIYDPFAPLSGDPAEAGGETSTGPGAAYATLSLAAEGTPIRRGPHALGADLFLTRTTYVRDDRADDFDTLRAGTVVRYRLTMARAARRHDLLFRYLFNTTTFDGGPLVEEETFYVFSESHTAVARWTLSPSEAVHVYLEARYGWEGFRDIRRVGPTAGLDLGVNRFLAGGRVKLYLMASLVAKDGWVDAYDYRGPTGFAGCSWRAPWRIDVAGTARYAHRSYFRSTGYEPWGMERIDDVVSSALSISRRMGARWRLEMDTRYVWHHATVEAFDYEKLTGEILVAGEW